MSLAPLSRPDGVRAGPGRTAAPVPEQRRPAQSEAAGSPWRTGDPDAARPAPRRGAPLVALALVAAGATGASCVASPAYGAAAALVAVLAVVGWARPRLVVCTAVLLAPVLPGLRRGLPVPGLRLSEILIVAAFVAGTGLLGGRRRQTWRALDWLWFVFCALNVVLGVAHLLGRDVPVVGDDLNKLAGPTQFFLLYRAVRCGLPSAHQRVVALRLGLLASVPVSLLALAQFFDVPGVRAAIIAMTDSATAQDAAFAGIVRTTGPFSHWHSLAGYLLLVVPLAVVLATTRRQRVLARPLLLAIAALDVVALLSTTTLVPIACTVLAVLVVALRRGRLLPVLAAGVVLAAVVGVLFGGNLAERVQSQLAQRAPAYEVAQPDVSWLPGNLGFRARVWTDQYLPVIADHAVTGYGPDTPPSVTWQSTESLYITLLMRGGVLLLASYALLWVAMWRRARDADTRGPARGRDAGDEQPHLDPHARAVGLTVWAGLIALTFAQLVHPYFTDAGLPHLLAVLVALLPVAASRRDLA